jgi:hypothetical protein
MSFSSDKPMLSNQLANYDSPDSYEAFSEIFQREHKRVVDAVNSKEGGLYSLQQVATFQEYFTPGNPQKNRNVYRKVINFGALPNNTSRTIPHNINFTNTTRLTRMYGASSNPNAIQFIPLPFASPTLANNVSIEANAAGVTVTTGKDYSGFVDTTIVLEYTQG